MFFLIMMCPYSEIWVVKSQRYTRASAAPSLLQDVSNVKTTLLSCMNAQIKSEPGVKLMNRNNSCRSCGLL